MMIKRILGTCAVMMAATVSAAALWFAGAGTALAPEPARVSGALYSNWDLTPAKYISTGGSTYAYQLSGSWFVSSIPAGTPCTTTPVPAGTIVTKVIIRSGSYARCA